MVPPTAGPLLLPLLKLQWLLLALLLLQLPSRLLLSILLLLLPLLLDGAKTGGPRRPSRDKRGRGSLIHRTDIPRSPVAARPVAYGDGIPLDPRSGRLGGSLLPLGLGRLGLFRRRQGRLRTGWGTLSAGRRLRVGGAYKTRKQKSVTMMTNVRATQIP